MKKVKNDSREKEVSTHIDTHIHAHLAKMMQCIWNRNPEDENLITYKTNKKIFKLRKFSEIKQT